MRLKLTSKLILAALFAAAIVPTYSQVAPTARQGGLPIAVGGGFSDFNLDYGAGRRMFGFSAWADWLPETFPGKLRHLGVESTGHAIVFDVPAGFSRMRQETAEVGPIYRWDSYHNVRPYVRYVIGIGSIDFPQPAQTVPYTHDTFLVMSPGGGAEYHLWQHIWVRADYEYQFWHHTFGPHDLTPNGFTVGATYDFGTWGGGSR